MIREHFELSAKPPTVHPHLALILSGASLHRRIEAPELVGTVPGGALSPCGVERSIDGKTYRFARAASVDQLLWAGRLVMRRYAWRGYDVGGAGTQTAVGEVTFVACCGARVNGTLTVRIDGPSVLLAERLYPDEISRQRRRGARLCEFGRLAFEECINTLEVLGPLFHLGMAFARRRHECTDMLIEVNPRHVGFYQRAFGFEVLGDERNCDRVAAPAVLLRLSLGRAAFHADARGGKRTGRKSIYPYCFGPDELAAMHREIRAIDGGGSEGAVELVFALC